MTDPGRAERLWLAIAVATVWLMRVRAEDEGRPGRRRHHVLQLCRRPNGRALLVGESRSV
jgi:hypothetical protein